MKRSNFPHRKEKRRKDAEERQAVYDRLTAPEKKARCASRVGRSLREKTRLTKGGVI